MKQTIILIWTGTIEGSDLSGPMVSSIIVAPKKAKSRLSM